MYHSAEKLPRDHLSVFIWLCFNTHSNTNVTFDLCWRRVLFFSLQGKFFWQVKIGYTIGHSVSLISLTTAIVILCIFRCVEQAARHTHHTPAHFLCFQEQLPFSAYVERIKDKFMFSLQTAALGFALLTFMIISETQTLSPASRGQLFRERIKGEYEEEEKEEEQTVTAAGSPVWRINKSNFTIKQTDVDVLPAGRYGTDNMTVCTSNTLNWDLITSDQSSFTPGQKYGAYVKLWKTGRKI